MTRSTASLVSLAPIVPPEPPGVAIGTILADRYRIDEQIGQGSMGRVYRAEHVRMNKRVAVKILNDELSKIPEMVARFEREAMAAARIEHPHVAAATDFGRTPDGVLFLVMDYVEGTPLSDLIEKGPLAPERAIHIARQMLSALERAHALGIIHRDIKPDNVLLVPRPGDPEFVMLLDFGIARLTPAEHPGKELTQGGVVFGTPEYMAPEQVRGEPVDARADLYAFGIVLYEMLTGRLPFEDDSPVKVMQMHLKQPPIPPAALQPPPNLDPRLEAIVMCLLEKAADARFASATAVKNALVALAPPEEDEAPAALKSIAGLRRPLGDARERIVAVAGDVRERAMDAWRRATPRARAIAGVTAGLVAVLLFALLLVPSGEPAATVQPRTQARADTVAPSSAQALNVPADERPAAPSPALDVGSGAELQLAIGVGLAQAGRLPGALARIEGALALAPELRDDTRVASVLVLGLGDRRTTERARFILRDILGSRAVPYLLEAARSTRPTLRRPALDLLEEIAPPGPPPG